MQVNFVIYHRSAKVVNGNDRDLQMLTGPLNFCSWQADPRSITCSFLPFGTIPSGSLRLPKELIERVNELEAGMTEEDGGSRNQF